jgi:hypothetical protein
LHAVWLLREPSKDKARWREIQSAIVRSFADSRTADPAIVAPRRTPVLN